MICPRCDDDRAGKIFEAPEDGSWELYRCPRCYFVWRSTEEEEVINPELYDPRFKLSEEKIAAMDPKPPIPPIRKENRRTPNKASGSWSLRLGENNKPAIETAGKYRR